MFLTTIYGEGINFLVVCPAMHLFSVFRLLSICLFHMMCYLCSWWTDFNGHKYLSREWALLKRFWRSEVRGQGHNQTLHWWRHTFQWCGVKCHCSV